MADLRVFFATDIHGSEVCFRKFLNSARFYQCEVLIMGGDMTGKMVAPIVDLRNGMYEVRSGGTRQEVSEADLPDLRQRIADAGMYGYETTSDGVAELSADPGKLEQVFVQLMTATLERWLRLAEERLTDANVRCFLAPGNDDPPFVDDLLLDSSRIVCPEGQLVSLGNGFEMISVGDSNPTPWDTPRELPEDELLARIESEVAKLASMERAIFNLHVPPKDTTIDQVHALDENLRPVLRGHAPVIVGAGSTAVREAIVRHQPMLALHGHIHESRGTVRLGRTLSVNPGSEYGEGVLRGAIISLSEKKGLRGCQLVAG